MTTVLLIILLAGLFYLLGKTADILVLTTRRIGELFNIHVFFLGIILGLLTTFPELSIAINSLVTGVPEISFGNLLGGIIVLMSLVLGGSIVLNRTINTDGKLSSVLPILILLFLPILASLDGNLNLTEGLALIVCYFLLLYYLYRQSKNHGEIRRIKVKKSILLKEGFEMLIGVVFVILISNLVIRLTLLLLRDYHIPTFVVGLLLFAIGTNLPEISIVIRSWYRKVHDLSLGSLVGSVISNVLVIGILAFPKTITVTLNASFLSLLFFLSLILIAFGYFYETGRAFTFREGILLLLAYGAFVASQIFFLAFKA